MAITTLSNNMGHLQRNGSFTIELGRDMKRLKGGKKLHLRARLLLLLGGAYLRRHVWTKIVGCLWLLLE